MAKRPSTIPAYKRKRARKGGIGRLLVKLFLWLFLISIGFVVLYRFVPPPITATMVGDLVGGRCLVRGGSPAGGSHRALSAARVEPRVYGEPPRRRMRDAGCGLRSAG